MILDYEGQQVEVPDDASDDFIRRVLQGITAPAASTDPAVAGATGGAVPETGPGSLAEAQPPRRMTHAGVQGAGRTLADVAGLPFDLTNMAANVGLAGADFVSRQVGGPEISYRFPMASDQIANAASRVAAPVFQARDPEKEMDAHERAAYNINRFGGQAAVTAPMLAATAAPRAAEVALRNTAPRLFDDFLRPYFEAPNATAARDVAAGAGGGLALTGSQSLPKETRESLGGVTGPLADLLAMGVGGVGTGSLADIFTRGPQKTIDRVRGSFIDRGITLDPETGAPVLRREADMAGKFMQRQTHNVDDALANIDAARNMDVVPTSGLASGDPGLIYLENALRAKHGGGTIAQGVDVPPSIKDEYSFHARDTALRDAAVRDVNAVRPEGGNPARFVEQAENVADAAIGQAERGVRRAEGQQRGVQMARGAEADELRAYQGQGPAASANIDETYRATRTEETARKNALFRDPELLNTPVPDQPLVQWADDLHRAEHPMAPLSDVVRKYVDRFRTPDADPDGVAPQRPPMTMGVVNDIRAAVEGDIQRSLREGGDVAQLSGLKRIVSRYADRLAEEGNPLAQEATRNYAERVRPNFREGAGGRLDSKLKGDPLGQNTQPSKTAENFLTRPEDAADLMRIARLGGNEAAVAGQARTWLLDRLARTGVATGEAIDPGKLARWRNVNGAVLDRIPGLRAEVDDMIRRAQRGERLSEQSSTALTAAQQRLAETQRAVKKGPLGMVAGKDPRNAVSAALASDNPAATLRGLKQAMRGRPDAEAGLKAAVADHFIDRVSGVNPAAVSEGSQNINFAALVKEFRKNRMAFGEVFSPEELELMTRAANRLEYLTKRGMQATVGSVTAERSAAIPRLAEAALKIKFGMLKGGGIFSTSRKVWDLVKDDGAEAANRLVARAMFDPELAKHLLSRNIKVDPGPAFNASLQRMIRRVEAWRAFQDDEE